MTIAEAETLSPILPLLLTVAEVALVTNTSSPIRPALVTVAGPPTIVVVVSLDRLIVRLPSLLVVFFVRLLKAWLSASTSPATIDPFVTLTGASTTPQAKTSFVAADRKDVG